MTTFWPLLLSLFAVAAFFSMYLMNLLWHSVKSAIGCTLSDVNKSRSAMRVGCPWIGSFRWTPIEHFFSFFFKAFKDCLLCDVGKIFSFVQTLLLEGKSFQTKIAGGSFARNKELQVKNFLEVYLKSPCWKLVNQSFPSNRHINHGQPTWVSS